MVCRIAGQKTWQKGNADVKVFQHAVRSFPGFSFSGSPRFFKRFRGFEYLWWIWIVA
jgi:hypothetical protein